MQEYFFIELTVHNFYLERPKPGSFFDVTRRAFFLRVDRKDDEGVTHGTTR